MLFRQCGGLREIDKLGDEPGKLFFALCCDHTVPEHLLHEVDQLIVRKIARKETVVTEPALERQNLLLLKRVVRENPMDIAIEELKTALDQVIGFGPAREMIGKPGDILYFVFVNSML